MIEINREMKIAIQTGFPAKRNMDVNTAHTTNIGFETITESKVILSFPHDDILQYKALLVLEKLNYTGLPL